MGRLSLRAVDDILLESAASSRSNLFNGTCSIVGECDLQLLLTAAEWVPDHQLPVRTSNSSIVGGLAKLLASPPSLAINFDLFHPHPHNPITNRYPFIVRPTAVLIEHVLERRGRKKTDRGFTTMCRHAGCRKRG